MLPLSSEDIPLCGNQSLEWAHGLLQIQRRESSITESDGTAFHQPVMTCSVSTCGLKRNEDAALHSPKSPPGALFFLGADAEWSSCSANRKRWHDFHPKEEEQEETVQISAGYSLQSECCMVEHWDAVDGSRWVRGQTLNFNTQREWIHVRLKGNSLSILHVFFWEKFF